MLKGINYYVNNKVSVTMNEATRSLMIMLNVQRSLFSSNYKSVRLHYQNVLVNVVY
jgi:hypothetical protein